MNVTEKEFCVLNAISKGQEYTYATIEEYKRASDDQEYDIMVDLDRISDRCDMPVDVVKGLISSLDKKGFIGIAEAEEYSLECNAYYLYDEGIELVAKVNTKSDVHVVTPSEYVKSCGVKSLRFVSEKTGVSEQTLSNWFNSKNKRRLFEVVVEGVKSL